MRAVICEVILFSLSIAFSGCSDGRNDMPVSLLLEEVDLGIVGGEQSMDATFHCRTWSKAPVRLVSLKSSCGCTTATSAFLNEILGPSTEFSFVAKIAPEEYVGPMSATVNVITEPPSTRPIIARLKGVVVREPVFSPTCAQVTCVCDQAAEHKLIATLSRVESAPALQIVPEQCNYSPFRLVEQKCEQVQRLPMGSEASTVVVIDRLELKLATDNPLPLGEHRFVFDIKWSNGKVAHVPVSATVKHPFDIGVKQLFFGAIPPGKSKTLDIRYAADNTAMAIRDVVSNFDLFTVRFDQEGLQVKVTAPLKEGRFGGEIRIRFLSGHLPDLVIPASGLVVMGQEQEY